MAFSVPLMTLVLLVWLLFKYVQVCTLFPAPLLTGGANSVQIEDWVESKVGNRVQSMADKARNRLRKQTAFDEESVRRKYNDFDSSVSSL